MGALRELDAIYRSQPDRQLRPDESHLAGPGHQLLLTKFGPLDVLGMIGKSRVWEDLRNGAEKLEIEPGVEVQVMDLETLIAVKEELGISQGRSDAAGASASAEGMAEAEKINEENYRVPRPIADLGLFLRQSRDCRDACLFRAANEGPVEGDEVGVVGSAAEVDGVGEVEAFGVEAQCRGYACRILGLDVGETEQACQGFADGAVFEAVGAAQDPGGFQYDCLTDPDEIFCKQGPRGGGWLGRLRLTGGRLRWCLWLS